MGEIRLITKSILLDEVKLAAQARFGDMVKAVVDIEKNVIALGGELHADEEALLLQNGSKQENLWGINLYVDLPWPNSSATSAASTSAPGAGSGKAARITLKKRLLGCWSCSI